MERSSSASALHRGEDGGNVQGIGLNHTVQLSTTESEGGFIDGK